MDIHMHIPHWVLIGLAGVAVGVALTAIGVYLAMRDAVGRGLGW